MSKETTTTYTILKQKQQTTSSKPGDWNSSLVPKCSNMFQTHTSPTLYRVLSWVPLGSYHFLTAEEGIQILRQENIKALVQFAGLSASLSARFSVHNSANFISTPPNYEARPPWPPGLRWDPGNNNDDVTIRHKKCKSVVVEVQIFVHYTSDTCIQLLKYWYVAHWFFCPRAETAFKL